MSQRFAVLNDNSKLGLNQIKPFWPRFYQNWWTKTEFHHNLHQFWLTWLIGRIKSFYLSSRTVPKKRKWLKLFQCCHPQRMTLIFTNFYIHIAYTKGYYTLCVFRTGYWVFASFLVFWGVFMFSCFFLPSVEHIF